MYKSIRVVLFLLLALGLAGAVACDSDSNGGGGTTTTGYTQADLAGRWRVTFSPGAVVVVAIEIDESGNVTSCYDKGGAWNLGEGRFTVNADGSVRGDFVERRIVNPATGTYDRVVNCFVFNFRDKVRLKGEMLQRSWRYTNGVPPPSLQWATSWTLHWNKVE